jgi:hypothetical protein
MKLLIKFPTRDRKDKFFKVLDKYYALLDNINNVEFCISIDDNDPTMNNDVVLDKLETYENLSYFIGYSKSKIEACNADINEIDDWDVVLLASDDMIPQVKGYDKLILENMEKYYPDTDGVLWFYDGNRKDLNTLCILGKKYYDRFNYIYHPGYKSFYCDDEFTRVANILNKQTFIETIIIKHEHPDIPQYQNRFDKLYALNNKYYPIDYNFFQLRLKNLFGIKKIK